jgi:hypothetical protein
MDNATIIGGGDYAQQTEAAAQWETLVNASAARVFTDRFNSWLQNSAIQKSTGLAVDPKPERPLYFHCQYVPGYGDTIKVGPDFAADYPAAPPPSISAIGKIDDVVGGIDPASGLRYNLSNKMLGEVHFAADGSIWQLVADKTSPFSAHWSMLKGAAV